VDADQFWTALLGRSGRGDANASAYVYAFVVDEEVVGNLVEVVDLRAASAEGIQ
jgi:hypothetical protein